MNASETVYLGLGSSLGDRSRNLAEAGRRLALAGLEVTGTSPEHQTEPVGGRPGDPPFLNTVVQGRTGLSPRDLLEACLRIERALGRVRGEQNAPRTIDIDLLLYGNRVIDEPGLVVPHPRMHQRRFVLEPLAELTPDLVHPRLGKTVRELLAALPG